jgi:hypothetical protein
MVGILKKIRFTHKGTGSITAKMAAGMGKMPGRKKGRRT